MKRLRFTTQFKIEFLLPFSSCRKVLGKIPEKKLEMFSNITSWDIIEILNYITNDIDSEDEHMLDLDS